MWSQPHAPKRLGENLPHLAKVRGALAPARSRSVLPLVISVLMLSRFLDAQTPPPSPQPQPNFVAIDLKTLLEILGAIGAFLGGLAAFCAFLWKRLVTLWKRLVTKEELEIGLKNSRKELQFKVTKVYEDMYNMMNKPPEERLKMLLDLNRDALRLLERAAAQKVPRD